MPPRPRFPGRPEPRKDEHRINDFIRVPVVRLVDANGQMVGEVPTEQARKMAREAGLDLVEVAPEAKPPVCKILDYGKFKYEESKSKKKKAKHHGGELKEVRLRPRTDDHDFLTKLKHARQFLEHGHKVLFTIFFRGREMAHKELGRARMEQIKRDLDDIAKVEHELSMLGPRMHLTMMPRPGGKLVPKPAAPKAPAAPPQDGAGPGSAPVPAPVAPPPPQKQAEAKPEPKETPNAQT